MSGRPPSALELAVALRSMRAKADRIGRTLAVLMRSPGQERLVGDLREEERALRKAAEWMEEEIITS